MKKQLPAIVASFALVLSGPLPSTFANPISIDHQVPKKPGNQASKIAKIIGCTDLEFDPEFSVPTYMDYKCWLGEEEVWIYIFKKSKQEQKDMKYHFKNQSCYTANYEFTYLTDHKNFWVMADIHSVKTGKKWIKAIEKKGYKSVKGYNKRENGYCKTY